MKYTRKILEMLYRTMLRIRLCEESLVEPIQNNEIRTPCHLYSGQEAIAAGVCAALTKEDFVFGNHRSHGHFLAKGGSMNEMMAEIFCRKDGCSHGRGGSMHLIEPETGMLGSAPIVAGTISLAVGAALASSIRNDGRIAVSFLGDGATGEGTLYESLNFASLKSLPIIFVCENNLYATHMPIAECRVDQAIHKVAEPFCITTQRVDGNDVLQVYESSTKAAKQCRMGKGPVFMEFLTYRLRGHVGPDDNIQGCHTDIRPRQEIEGWREKDPIHRLKNHILENNVTTEEALHAIEKEVATDVAEAHAFAHSGSAPDPEELEKFIFKA